MKLIRFSYWTYIYCWNKKGNIQFDFNCNNCNGISYELTDAQNILWEFSFDCLIYIYFIIPYFISEWIYTWIHKVWFFELIFKLLIHSYNHYPILWSRSPMIPKKSLCSLPCVFRCTKVMKVVLAVLYWMTNHWSSWLVMDLHIQTWTDV